MIGHPASWQRHAACGPWAVNGGCANPRHVRDAARWCASGCGGRCDGRHLDLALLADAKTDRAIP